MPQISVKFSPLADLVIGSQTGAYHAAGGMGALAMNESGAVIRYAEVYREGLEALNVILAEGGLASAVASLFPTSPRVQIPGLIIH